MPQWRLLLPPQPLQNQRSENTPEHAGQQGKHNISDGHRDNLPSLPDWLGWAVAASVYHKTHEKIPLRLVNAVGFFVCSFIRARDGAENLSVVP